ncbi:hydroxyethylthiazole kinase [Paraliobacillus ryukyuensis]|uniref:hydroxyethylthiazole kinase n=1 Tax=Paraliobacillus ryukyuensis TaxID=200904 RepID=UPI0021189AC6|nr:hydroxyethylthiazole kinase [Paraliobacillus ryukyuensis]
MNIPMMIDAVRSKNPLIHNITNQVVVNFTANGLYALGASPVMANAVEETADMARNADALLLNIGTLTSDQVEAMIEAGKVANEKGIPVVFDPVGVGATPYRNQVAAKILEEVNVSIVRGNAGEVSQLAGLEAEVRGVDASGTTEGKAIARHAVEALGVPVLVTGKTDVITDGKQLFEASNGSSLLTKVTGTGCLLGSVVAAFLASHPDEAVVKAATAAVTFYNVAAEQATAHANGPGSFQMAFLDALTETTNRTVSANANTKHHILSEE